jgi:hypothetical protein
MADGGWLMADRPRPEKKGNRDSHMATQEEREPRCTPWNKRNNVIRAVNIEENAFLKRNPKRNKHVLLLESWGDVTPETWTGMRVSFAAERKARYERQTIQSREQIVGILRKAEEAKTAREVIRRYGISEMTF